MNSPLQQAIACLHIRDVMLRNSSAYLAEGFEPTYGDGLEDIEIQFKHLVIQNNVMEATNGESIERIFRVFISLGARWVESSPTPSEYLSPASKNPIIKAQVEATYVADYDMSEHPGQEALDAFSLKNASYHVWPYWREYLASQCQRMGLRKIVMPAVQFAANEHHSDADKEQPIAAEEND